MSAGDGFSPVDHITEREPGAWRDCTFAAMVEFCRAGFPDGTSIPPTGAEREALRAAAGLPDDHRGATLPQAIDAARSRYALGGGWRLTSSWAVIRAALMDGAILVVQGSMGSVPPRLRRWDPSFSGPHSVSARGTTWCDPLAPKGEYVGEVVSLATWESYMGGLPGAQALITTRGGLTRMAGDFIVADQVVECRRTGNPRQGAPFYNDWQRTDQRGVIGPGMRGRVQVLGHRAGSLAVQITTAQGWKDDIRRPTLVFMSELAVVDIRDEPDPTPYSQAEVDAAYARGRAEGDKKHTVTVTVDDGRPPTTITGV